MDFPPVTMRDMVAVQAKLIEHLGISQLFAVIGGSMGGMQALAWAVHFPERVRVCVPIATCVSHNAMQIAFNEIGRRAIITDPNWNGGNYTPARRPEPRPGRGPHGGACHLSQRVRHDAQVRPRLATAGQRRRRR